MPRLIRPLPDALATGDPVPMIFEGNLDYRHGLSSAISAISSALTGAGIEVSRHTSRYVFATASAPQLNTFLAACPPAACFAIWLDAAIQA